MPIFAENVEVAALGVPGLLTTRATKDASHNPPPNVWYKQRWVSEFRNAPKYGRAARIRVEMRYDDECGNGHNTFAITGDVYEIVRSGREREIAGGCLHEDIAEIFPELAPLIKWHLCSADGPMHYLQNTIFLAGDRDCWGARKGEPHQWETVIRFGKNPIAHKFRQPFIKFLEDHKPLFSDRPYDFEILAIYHDDQGKPGKHQFRPKYTFGGYADKWHECPFDDEQEAVAFLTALQQCEPHFAKIATVWSEGKTRELHAARRCAVWPDASDEILTGDPAVLSQALVDRLPALIKEFRADMESAGFLWEPPAT